MAQPEYLNRIQCTGPPRPYSILFPPAPSEPYLDIPLLSSQPIPSHPSQDPPSDPSPSAPPSDPSPSTPPSDPSPLAPPSQPRPSIPPSGPISLTYAELVLQTRANSEARSAWFQAFLADQASPSDLRLSFPHLGPSSLLSPNRVQIIDLPVPPSAPLLPEPPLVIPPLDPLPSSPPSPLRPTGSSHRRRAVIRRRLR